MTGRHRGGRPSSHQCSVDGATRNKRAAAASVYISRSSMVTLTRLVPHNAQAHHGIARPGWPACPDSRASLCRDSGHGKPALAQFSGPGAGSGSVTRLVIPLHPAAGDDNRM
jgi:hypothetical protein